ncbi:MAG: tetratricopeptide repeat protein [Pirellulaceae bacterium]|nr:tetratricopeptide repeat protein [Pirellulaceae bacterium]
MFKIPIQYRPPLVIVVSTTERIKTRKNASTRKFFLAGMAYNRRHREDPTFPRSQFLLFPDQQRTTRQDFFMKWLSMIGEWQRKGRGFLVAGLTLIGGLFTISGCGSSNHTAKNDTEPNDGTPSPASSGTDAIQISDPSLATQNSPAQIATADTTTTTPTISGSEWLEQQVRQAAELRRTGQYANEAEHWKNAVRVLEQTIGSGNWITAGARLSRQVAVRLAELNPQQIAEWKQFESLEKKFLQNRDEMSELRYSGRITPAQYVTASQDQLDLLDRQAKIVHTLFGQPSHLLANLAYNQAETLMSVEQWEPALIAAERCLSQRQAVIQVRHPDTVAAFKLMGQIAQKLNNDSIAEDCLLKATQSAEQVWGTKNVAYATCANDLGVFYYGLESKKSAEGVRDYSKPNYWLERGLQIRREALGDGHRLVALSRRNYALSKMAEAATKPTDRQALDLALANSLLSQALQTLRNQQDATTVSLQWQATSEAATVKMLLHEYSEAEVLLAEIAEKWQADPQHATLPVSPATLFYRWGLASAKQKLPHKLVAAGKLMQQSVRYAEADKDEKTATSAKQALARLQEIARDGLGDAIPDRAVVGTPVQTNRSSAELIAPSTPVRLVSLPPVDDQN